LIVKLMLAYIHKWNLINMLPYSIFSFFDHHITPAIACYSYRCNFLCVLFFISLRPGKASGVKEELDPSLLYRTPYIWLLLIYTRTCNDDCEIVEESLHPRHFTPSILKYDTIDFFFFVWLFVFFTNIYSNSQIFKLDSRDSL